MSARFDIRTVSTSSAAEVYISAIPDAKVPPEQQAGEIYEKILQILRQKDAFIMQERIFAAGEAIHVVNAVRFAILKELNDDFAPVLLLCKPGSYGSFAGVQIYAVAADAAPQTIYCGKSACGRVLDTGDKTLLLLSGVTGSADTDAGKQASEMLETAHNILKQYGGNLLSVPRTWMWLGDILNWYDQFNQVRNDFFNRLGALDSGNRNRIPASTGIGLGPPGPYRCSMDLTAVIRPQDSIEYFPSTGRQSCAYEYGSAFSRATKAQTPAARTAFISGTASIDIDGNTTNIGDAAGQIAETIKNVQAALRDTGCSENDVVQLLAYCKSADVRRRLEDVKSHKNWPWIPIICDICRDNLLFEIEAAAVTRIDNSMEIQHL